MNYLQDSNRVTSRIALIFVALCLPYYLIFDHLALHHARAFVLPTAMPAAIAYALYRLKQPIASKVTLIIGTALCLFVAADILGANAGMETLTLALLPFPFLLFSYQEKSWVAGCTLIILTVYLTMGNGLASLLVQPETMSQVMSEWIRRSAEITTFLLLTLSSGAYFLNKHADTEKLALYTQSLEINNTALQTAYTALDSQQTLLKRRITAIHEMTADCADLPEWERVCRNVFRYQLNLTPQIWVATGGTPLPSRMKGAVDLPSIIFTKDDDGRYLLHDIDCFPWIADGVSVVLPIVSGTTLQAVIGLSPTEPLSTEDLDFAVMVIGALQKSLQLIRSAETLKTLNMSTFVSDNEALFREFRITDRELEIIGMLVQGMSNAQISARLVVTEATTKRHVYNIFQKLGIKSRFELVGWVGDRAVAG
jgi:DNA-binding CsgD family transcriptional regulator